MRHLLVGVRRSYTVNGQAQYRTDCVHEGKCAGDSELFTLFSAPDKTDDICIDLQMNGKEVTIWLDTGTSLLLVPEYIQRQAERLKSHINSTHIICWELNPSLG